VAVVQGGVLTWRAVEIEGDFGDRLAVSSGLAEGDMVAVAPSDRLVDGMRVRAEESPAPGSPVAETKPSSP
jgi:hypothetical protein